MPVFAAFLRGMNVGGRRIKNPELIAAFEAIGYTDVGAFLASGNVVLTSQEADEETVAAHIEKGLQEQLGYAVATCVRTAAAVRAAAAASPFTAEEIASSEGKPQVMFLRHVPSPEATAAVLALESPANYLRLDGRELHWLPEAGLSVSTLDLRFIEKTIGPTTIRTQRTVTRMVAKFFA